MSVYLCSINNYTLTLTNLIFLTVASVMLCATPLSLVLSSGSECCNAKSNIPDQNWLNVLDVTHGHSKKWLCYTKGKPCCGDCTDCCCPGFHHFPSVSCFSSLSPSKMTFTENCFLQGDFDNRLPFGVEEKSGLWSLLSSIWIMMNQPALSVVVCTCYLCFPVSYTVVLSIGHLDVLHRWI